MAIDRTPVLKRCRQLGIDPDELGYSSKKESIRQPTTPSVDESTVVRYR